MGRGGLLSAAPAAAVAGPCCENEKKSQNGDGPGVRSVRRVAKKPEQKFSFFHGKNSKNPMILLHFLYLLLPLRGDAASSRQCAAAVAGPCCEREKKTVRNGDYRCIQIPAVGMSNAYDGS
jgi:hypothetical protein